MPECFAAVLPVDPQLARALAVKAVTFNETRDESVSFGFSAVLPMNESRRQQATSAWYALGRVFPAACTTDVVTCAQVVADLFAATEEDDPPTQQPTSPLDAYGVDGWLKYGYGIGSLRYDDRRDVVKALSDALQTAPHDSAQAALTYLTEHLHGGKAWSGLMQKPTDAGRLATLLWPVMTNGTLLTHPDTAPTAIALTKAALAAGAITHTDVEAAVAQAVRVIEANGKPEGRKHAVVGCLTRGHIQDADLAKMRAALGDLPPQLADDDSIEGGGTPWSPVDDHPDLSAEVRAAATALTEANQQVNDTRGSADVYPVLLEAFTQGQSVFANEPGLPESVAHLLVSAAGYLAGYQATEPETDDGNRVLDALLAAAANPNAGEFMK
jgi:hypothetical protein